MKSIWSDPGASRRRPCKAYKPYKSYNFYSFDTPSGGWNGSGGGVHFVGIVGIVAFLSGLIGQPSRKGCRFCRNCRDCSPLLLGLPAGCPLRHVASLHATSPTGRGKCTPVGGGQAVVRRTCSQLCLTAQFTVFDGGTLGSLHGGTNSDRCQQQKQGAVSGCVSEALPAAETAELEQGQPSKFASAPRARLQFGQRQPGAALRFLQAPAVARRKKRLSARGAGTGCASAL